MKGLSLSSFFEFFIMNSRFFMHTGTALGALLISNRGKQTGMGEKCG
jgi:hypothetical protein